MKMNNELIYPSKSIKPIMKSFSNFPPPVNWRVENYYSNFEFIILLDDDRRITIQKDPDPRSNPIDGNINIIEFLFNYPIAMDSNGNNLDWVHRFADRINWIIPSGKVLVDNDKDIAPNGVIWLKNSVNLKGGISNSWLREQFISYLKSMEFISNYHNAESNSPLMNGKWI